MTGIKTYKFSAADKQRVTWSKYYVTNCVKGAGGIQPCTWGVTVQLWAGRASDSDYHENSGYVQAMQEFQEKDLVPVSIDSITGTGAVNVGRNTTNNAGDVVRPRLGQTDREEEQPAHIQQTRDKIVECQGNFFASMVTAADGEAQLGHVAGSEGPTPSTMAPGGVSVRYEVVPFTHVLDKGYQVTRFNWDHGKQRTIQPVFGRSNQKFKGEDTLFSGMVASLRSGNERWILVCKRPGFIKEGFKPGMCPKVFDDVWLGWGFQANFMYKPAM